MVGDPSNHTSASLAGSTGVETADDVVRYLLAGADVVMTTASLIRNGVGHISSLVDGLVEWCQRKEFGSLDEVRGSAVPVTRTPTRSQGPGTCPPSSGRNGCTVRWCERSSGVPPVAGGPLHGYVRPRAVRLLQRRPVPGGRALKAGHRVQVIAPRCDGPTRTGRRGADRVPAPSIKLPGVPAAVAGGKGFRESDQHPVGRPSDVIHVHGLGPVGMLGVWVADQTGVPWSSPGTPTSGVRGHYSHLTPFIAPTTACSR